MDPMNPTRKSQSESASNRRTGSVAAANTGTWPQQLGNAGDELLWHNLPQYRLSASGAGSLSLSIILECTTNMKDLIGVLLIPVSKETDSAVIHVPKSLIQESVGFTPTTSVSKAVSIQANSTYVVAPQIRRLVTSGPALKFTLTLTISENTSVLTVAKLRKLPCQEIRGEWTRETSGGRLDSETFICNPQFKIETEEFTKVSLLLLQRDISLPCEVGVYIFRLPKSTIVGKLQNIAETPVASTSFEHRQEAFLEFDAEPQFQYYAIPSTKTKGTEASFSLKAFAPKTFQLLPSHVSSKTGEWAGLTAGGAPMTSSTWMNNPQFILSVQSRVNMKVNLLRIKEIAEQKAPSSTQPASVSIQTESFPMMFFVLPVPSPQFRVWIEPNELVSSASATEPTVGDALSQFFDLGENGFLTHYCIVPCLQTAGKTGKFRLEVRGTSTDQSPFEFAPIQPSFKSSVAEGRWNSDNSGGSTQGNTWMLNPQYGFTAPVSGVYIVSLGASFQPLESIGFHAFKLDSSHSTVSRIFTKQDEMGRAEFRRTNQLSRALELTGGERIVLVPATFTAGIVGSFTLTVFSAHLVSLVCLEGQYATTSISGSWLASRRGGSLKYSSWRENPHYQLRIMGLDSPTKCTILLANKVSSPTLQIGAYVSQCTNLERQDLILKKTDLLNGSPDFKESPYVTTFIVKPDVASSSGFIVIPATKIPLNSDNVNFSLSIYVEAGALSSRVVPTLTRIFQNSSGWKLSSVSGQWTPSDSGGCSDNKSSWALNRMYNIKVAQPNTRLLLLLLKPSWIVSGIYLLKSNIPKVKYIVAMSEFIYGSKEASLDCLLDQPGEYSIMPCTYMAGEVGSYNLLIHSDKPVELHQGARKPTGRENCIAEIAKTEKSYAQDLHSMVEYFRHPIASQGASIMTQAELSSVFSNAVALRDLHKQLASDVETSSKTEDPMLGRIFLKLAPLLKIYTDYYRSYFNGIQVLDQCMKRPKTASFIDGLNDSFMSSDPSNRTLRDLLIAPVQRIPRYVMLLQQLGKLTNADHDDYADINEAASMIEAELTGLNVNLRKFDGLKKVVELEDVLLTREHDRFPLMSATRYHLHDGMVKIARGPGAPENRFVFLFNDLLLIAVKYKEKFVVEWTFNSGLKVELAAQDPPQIRCGAFVFQLASIGEIQKWMDSFKHASALTGTSSWVPPASTPTKSKVAAVSRAAYSSAPASPADRATASKRAFSSLPNGEEMWYSSSLPFSSNTSLAYNAENEPAPQMPEDDDEGDELVMKLAQEDDEQGQVPRGETPLPPSDDTIPTPKPNGKLIFDYLSGKEGHLDVRKDDLIIIDYTHEHWIQARALDGKYGWVPKNYIVQI